MNGNLRIAPLTKMDITSFTNLWNQSSNLLTSSGLIMTDEKALEGFNKKMFDYFGLYENRKLIGFILYQHDGKEIWLKHMLIDENHRKLKLGSMFLKETLSSYKGGRVKTEVLFENKIATDFFTKNGFKITSRDKINQQNILSS